MQKTTTDQAVPAWLAELRQDIGLTTDGQRDARDGGPVAGLTVYANGIAHKVISVERDRGGFLLAIARPAGKRVHLARWLGDSPIYGENRVQILAPMGWR